MIIIPTVIYMKINVLDRSTKIGKAQEVVDQLEYKLAHQKHTQ